MSATAGTVYRIFAGLKKDPLGMAGFVLVSLIVFLAVFAAWLAPYDPLEVDVYNRLASPSFAHWLGTDQLGRDILSRVLYGGQVALRVSLLAISISMAVGLVLGMLAGFGPRWLDRVLVVAFDTVRSFPTIMFALAVVALTGPSLNTVIGVIIVTSIPVYARVVRTQTLALRERDFILAERAMGASTFRILRHHVLPNIIAPLFILASMDVPAVVGMEAGLSFLGLGVSPPTPSWGSILNDGYSYLRNSPWPIIAGGLPLIAVTLGFTFFGESLRDIFDPRLRRKDQ
ncbi:MAG: ABC transporter permease [Xanthomonadales bacterium]|nr:ABC transporter permease [Gammaproteobacteria bacterium]MBT8055264.1 ABC transporter permease [Gammaproteobacteria bacterium]NND55796.1 ABC transporter permease [Xanthomonadales bacterium]NNK50060.1 ABC transporter permease [Xanthomonadales bacterium]